MNTSSLYIKNAKIVTSNGSIHGDLLMEEGKIKQIGTIKDNTASRTIDAKNQFVLPGGIDAHVHFKLKTKGIYTADDFESGSKAALAGGTTTIIDFVTPSNNQSLHQALESRKVEAAASYTDYAFHQSITHWNQNTEREMKEAVQQYGITSFKVYLAYQDTIGIDFSILEKVMEAASKLDALVMIHAEVGELIKELEDKVFDKQALLKHQLTHPAKVEYMAIVKALELVEKTSCKTYFVHVSTQKGIELINNAKKKGLPVFAETCPQYFLFHDQSFRFDKDMEVYSIMSPPIRSINNKRAIFNAVSHRQFDCIHTDHCAFMKSQKMAQVNSYEDMPNGIGGVQQRLSLVLNEFVSSGILSWQDFALLTADRAAKIFGLPNKGSIKVGNDADLVIYKENPKMVPLREYHDFSKSDIHIYANKKVRFIPDIVIKSGIVVFEDGIFKDPLPSGKYLQKN